jgi:hypothetical protein
MRDLVRLLLGTIVAGVLYRLLAMAIPLVIVMSLGVRPDSLGIVAAAWRDVLTDTVALKWTGLILLRTLPALVGFIAASLNPRARIPAALTLGAFLAATTVYALAFVPNVSPWIRTLPLLNAAPIVLGGVLRGLMDRPNREIVAHQIARL